MPKKFVVVDKVAMEKGYMEMADINLAISNYSITAEEEGWRLGYGKVDKENPKGDY